MGATLTDYQQAAALAMSEADLTEQVRALADGLGIHRWHTFNSRRSPAGWVDEVLAGRRGVLFRELKTATGRLTPAQVACIDRLRAGGLDVDVWRPADLVSGRIAAEMREVA